MSVNELKQKKLINEFNRKLEGENPDTLQKNSNIPEDILKFQSIEGIVTDPENRTLWINGMPYGNAYAVASSTATENGPFHAEVFNDFETNTTESDYSHVEGQSNKIGSKSTGSHAEGNNNKINIYPNDVKPEDITDSLYNHAEGSNNILFGNYSHVEGSNNKLSGDYSHVEGFSNQISSDYTHAEGSSNTSSSKAKNSHIEGYNNSTTNEYEHAEGMFNYSVLYSAENGGDFLNDDNAIVSTVGVGINSNNRKNAIRVNRDGSVYLGSVIKRTDTVTEVFDPCNYDGKDIYETSITNNTKREVKSKSVQELLATINHSEKITYWRLLQLSQTNTLMPGKSYRITDYNPGLHKDLNTFVDGKLPKAILSSQTIEGVNTSASISTNKENLNRFDIIVTAISESEISNIAKACPHDYYGNEEKKDYFVGTNFNDWILYYDLTNDNSKYPWVSTESKEPSIKISRISTTDINNYVGPGFFNNFGNLDGYVKGTETNKDIFSKTYKDVKIEDNEESYRYFNLTDKVTIGALEPYGIGIGKDVKNIFKNFNTLTYTYAGAYFYRDETEKNFDNEYKQNPDNYTGLTPTPSLKTHNYNYKWLINIEGDVSAKDFEFCLLSNEADFSYMKSNGGIQDTNILFCKNDKTIDVTAYDKVVSWEEEMKDESGNTMLDNEGNPQTTTISVGPYYDLPENYPYVIQIGRNINDVLHYSAFIYDGPYHGNYGEIENATQDRWYILNNYDPIKNIYTVNKDSEGTQILLINRKNAGDADIDFNDWDNSLKNALEEKSGTTTIYNTFVVSKAPIVIADSGTDFKNKPYCAITSEDKKNEIGETYTEYTISLPKTLIDSNYSPIEGQMEIEYYIKTSYKYSYNGSEYTVWKQTKTFGDEYNFIITNPDETEEINENNVTKIILINCPVRNPEYYLSIENSAILEYYGINVKNGNASDLASFITESDKLGLKFPVGKFGRNVDKIVFQNDKYFVTYNLLNNDFSYDNLTDFNNERLNLYRVIVEYKINMLYTPDNITEIKPNFTYNITFEENLLPICYAKIDTSVPNGEYYTEGNYESTGVIYRMIDEFGNDCPYDFKNIKFFNDSVSTETASTKTVTINYPQTYTDFKVGEPVIIHWTQMFENFELKPGEQKSAAFGPPCKIDYQENIGLVITDASNGNFLSQYPIIIDLPIENTGENDLNLNYSYTFDGIITDKITNEVEVYKKNEAGKYVDINGNELTDQEHPENGGVLITETQITPIDTPYKDLRCIGDFSLTGKCVNNKILYPKLSDNGLNYIYFRLAIDSSLINNTFIDCNNCGSALNGLLEKGSKTNMLNNIFKECKNLDLINYGNISNNYFYNFSDSTLDGLNETSKIINSTIIDSSIGIENGAELNIIESKISDSVINGLKTGNFINSTIFQNSKNLNDEFDEYSNNNYNLISYDGIFFNKEYNSINADKEQFIVSSNGYITLDPQAVVESKDNIQLYANRYSQTLSYNDSLYRYDDVGETRDNKWLENSVKFTYNFDKHTIKNEAKPASGYGYTLPEIYYGLGNNAIPSGYSAISTSDPSYGPNKLFLGTFYVNCKWRIWTFWGQSKAVQGSSSLSIKVTLYDGDGLPITNFTAKAEGSHNNYWSQQKWSTYTQCPYINFDKFIKTDSSIEDKPCFGKVGSNRDGSIIISEGGKLTVSKIVFEVNAHSYANSTGANNCVEDVWISWLCHKNNSTWGDTAGLGCFYNAQTEYFNDSNIYYYKPSKYFSSQTNDELSEWKFVRNGIIFANRIYKFTETGISVADVN